MSLSLRNSQDLNFGLMLWKLTDKSCISLDSMYITQYITHSQQINLKIRKENYSSKKLTAFNAVREGKLQIYVEHTVMRNDEAKCKLHLMHFQWCIKLLRVVAEGTLWQINYKVSFFFSKNRVLKMFFNITCDVM